MIWHLGGAALCAGHSTGLLVQRLVVVCWRCTCGGLADEFDDGGRGKERMHLSAAIGSSTRAREPEICNGLQCSRCCCWNTLLKTVSLDLYRRLCWPVGSTVALQSAPCSRQWIVPQACTSAYYSIQTVCIPLSTECYCSVPMGGLAGVCLCPFGPQSDPTRCNKYLVQLPDQCKSYGSCPLLNFAIGAARTVCGW